MGIRAFECVIATFPASAQSKPEAQDNEYVRHLE
jgi:hypothetical protein